MKIGSVGVTPPRATPADHAGRGCAGVDPASCALAAIDSTTAATIHVPIHRALLFIGFLEKVTRTTSGWNAARLTQARPIAAGTHPLFFLRRTRAAASARFPHRECRRQVHGLDIFLYRNMIVAVPRAATSSDVFNAVAEPQRRAILEFLARDERPVGDIVDALELAQPSISK